MRRDVFFELYLKQLELEEGITARSFVSFIAWSIVVYMVLLQF